MKANLIGAASDIPRFCKLEPLDIMRICILGGDGYCGWATALYLSKRGHQVSILDNFLRRQWDFELGVQTLTPIRPLAERLRAWQELTGEVIELFTGDVT